MRSIASVLLVAALVACSPKAAQPDPAAAPVTAEMKTLGVTGESVLTPDQVKAWVDQHGANVVVKGLFDAFNPGFPDNLWAQVENGIADGDAAWIALAPALQPGTDAASAEGLKLSLTAGLSKNAEAILKIANAPFDLTELCTIALIEPAPGQEETFRADVVAGVEKVADPALKASKDACLAALKAAPATPAEPAK